MSDPFEAAEQADEGPALGAGIPLRGTLFTAAGAALHGIVFVELAHRTAQDVMLYRLILLISVARDMPSSMAALVRFPL